MSVELRGFPSTLLSTSALKFKKKITWLPFSSDALASACPAASDLAALVLGSTHANSTAAAAHSTAEVPKNAVSALVPPAAELLSPLSNAALVIIRIKLVSAPDAAVPAQTACVNFEGSSAASPYTAGCASPSTTPMRTAIASSADAGMVPRAGAPTASPPPREAATASHAGTAATSTAKTASPPTALALGKVRSCDSSSSRPMNSRVTGR